MAFLVDDILFSPITLIKWVAEKIKEAAEEEMTDESKVQGEILELQMLYEMGEITEEEYQKKETKLMERLEAIRRYKEQ